MKKLLVALTVCSTVLALVSCESKITVEEGIASVDWLSSSASDISYSESRGWKAYECKMTEASFVAWVEADGLNPVEITQPVRIFRYNWLTAAKSTPRDETSHEITRGLHVQDISPGGAGYDLGFDRDEEKVYYHYQAH